MTDEQMGYKLKRVPESIKTYRIELLGKGFGISEEQAQKARIRSELRVRPEWKYMKEQFTQDELDYFEYAYTNLMAQFRNDVLATEEKQIFQVIELEIFLNRNKRNYKNVIDNVEKMEKLVDKEYQKKANGETIDKDFLSSLDTQIQSARASQTARINEYKTLFEKHQSVMGDLKATRNQRIKSIEGARTSYIEFIKSLEQAEIRSAEEEQIQIMQLAVEKEYKRLGDYHQYADHVVDRPILNAETVMWDEDGQTPLIKSGDEQS